MPDKIVLIRHGETSWSITGQHTGRTDLPLTASGERCAAKLRSVLQGTRFTQVFTSPMGRARRTCELAGLRAVAHVRPDLDEWDYGAFEGLTTTEICRRQPNWNIYQNGCPEGESVSQIARRADRLLDALRLLNGNIALFSHGQFLRVLALRWIGQATTEGMHLALDTASMSILGFEHHNGDIPAICLWNSKPGTAGLQ